MKRLTFSMVASATDTKVQRIAANQLRNVCAGLTPRIESYRRGCDTIKKTLPAICWAAHFADGKRHAESAEATGLAYMDIDHLEAPREWYDSTLLGSEAELGIVHVQVSPGGKGLHIVFIPRRGDSIEAAQADLAERAGIADYDRQCKDVARMMFLSDLNDTLYDALDTLYEDVQP